MSERLFSPPTFNVLGECKRDSSAGIVAEDEHLL